MKLSQKKIAFLGDSITAGCGVADPANLYWRLLSSHTDAVCYGHGLWGTRIAMQRNPSPEPIFDRHFASRLAEMPADLDLIIVFGGTNDYGHGDAPLGDMHSTSEYSFYGALHHLIQKAITRYPDAQLVFMTPLHRLSECELGVNEYGVRREVPLEAYVKAITDVCGYYGVPVLDLFRTSGIQPCFPVLRERYMPDGLHPNDAGHRKIAARLESFLKAL